ncbi:unnamed protein product [Caenorhabditis brenneri]
MSTITPENIKDGLHAYISWEVPEGGQLHKFNLTHDFSNSFKPLIQMDKNGGGATVWKQPTGFSQLWKMTFAENGVAVSNFVLGGSAKCKIEGHGDKKTGITHTLLVNGIQVPLDINLDEPLYRRFDLFKCKMHGAGIIDLANPPSH